MLIAAALLAGAFLLAAGAWNAGRGALRPGDFFAAEVGTRWRYLGHGNEFAAYSAAVTHREGDLFQIVVFSGANVAHVYEIRPDRVVRRLRSGELESWDQNFLGGPFHEEYTVLEAPLRAGHAWETTAVFPNGVSVETRRVDGVGLTVDTPAGRFEHVIRVRVFYESGNEALEYYAPGVGLVRSEYLLEEPIISELESFALGLRGSP